MPSISATFGSMLIQEHVDLQTFNAFGLKARARYFLNISSVDEYDPLWLQSYEALLLLGGGSNILLADDFSGLILKIDIQGKEIVNKDEGHVCLRVGAGENWHELVIWTLDEGWSGIENLSLIPGTVGAAPIQNIGAYGVELSQVLESVEGIFLADGSPFKLSASECQFGYRDSLFKQAWKGKVLISHVTLRLNKTFEPQLSYGAIQDVLEEKGIKDPTAKDVSQAVIQIRSSKLPDPAELGNAGSFFKNPVISLDQYEYLKNKFPGIPHYPVDDTRVKVPAGWLIEQAGWKGKRSDRVGMHDRQALVLVNYGGASGAELIEHANKVADSVREMFDIQLEREVTLIE